MQEARASILTNYLYCTLSRKMTEECWWARRKRGIEVIRGQSEEK